MEENSSQQQMEEESQSNNYQVGEEERDPESNSLQQPLLKRNKTSLSSNPLAIIGAKVSHIESLDYE